MDYPPFYPEQIDIAGTPISTRMMLEGPAGSGKTTAGILRMLALIQAGVPASSILILVPQRTLGLCYQREFNQSSMPSGPSPTVATLGGLAQRMLALFWPMVAGNAGFKHPYHPPGFLTMETAQNFLAKLVQEKLQAGYFQTVKIERNRLLSQILDNLNKAAGNGFAPETIADRLKSAWIGEPAQRKAYEEAQECSNEFRRFCLQNNLLDFSLQLETFFKHLWPSFICREYLFREYQHLIYDNVEEDVPIVHDVIRQCLPRFSSALLILDTNAGYRSFLGADPDSAASLEANCDRVITFSEKLKQTPGLVEFRKSLDLKLRNSGGGRPDPVIRTSINFSTARFVPEMVESISSRISSLILDQHIPPGEIVVLSPFLPDSLRFTLVNALAGRGIPTYTHRPSRSLREEPAARCLITLTKLAHPQWNMTCSPYDIRSAFVQVFEGLDLIRADLLGRITFKQNKPLDMLGSFDLIHPDMQARITYQIGEKFEKLRFWIEKYREDLPLELDIFLSRLFGEVLSLPGFGFHLNYDSASVTARLVESVQKFRQVIGKIPANPAEAPLGLQYLQMIEEGIIAAQYLHTWEEKNEEAVLIAPAYTFLLANHPVDYQFWLDIGSRSWSERLYQPLTHPYVLSRKWQEGRPWTDADEVATNQKTLTSLTNGLLRRCRKGVFMVANRINERGDEQRGPLLMAVQSIFRQIAILEKTDV